MKRTIKTPHDVVQVLIDIIAAHENDFTLTVESIGIVRFIFVEITTKESRYICEYEIGGNYVNIDKYKYQNYVNKKVQKASTYKVRGRLTTYLNRDLFPIKSKIIKL